MIDHARLVGFLEQLSDLRENREQRREHLVYAFPECLQTIVEMVNEVTGYDAVVAEKSGQKTLLVQAANDKGRVYQALPLEGPSRSTIFEGATSSGVNESGRYEIAYPLLMEHVPVGVLRIESDEQRDIEDSRALSFCIEACEYALSRSLGDYSVGTIAHETKNKVIKLGIKIRQSGLEDRGALEAMLSEAESALLPLHRNYQEPEFLFDRGGSLDELYLAAHGFFQDSLRQFHETRNSAVEATQRALDRIVGSAAGSSDILAVCEDLRTMTGYLEKNTTEFYPREIKLNETLHHILYGDGGIESTLDVNLVFNPDPLLDDRKLRFSPRGLQQIIHNTLMNSQRALTKIPDADWDRSVPRTITVATRYDERDRTYVLEISDNANGFPQTVIDKFGEQKNKSDDEGSNGYGIAFCCGEADKHRAAFRIKDTGRNGSTLELVIPDIQYNPAIAISLFEESVRWVEEGPDYRSFCDGSDVDSAYKGLYRMFHYVTSLIETTRTSRREFYISALERIQNLKEFWSEHETRILAKAEQQPDLVVNDPGEWETNPEVKTISYFVSQAPFILSLHEAGIYKAIALSHAIDDPVRVQYFQRSISTLAECMELAGDNLINMAKVLNNRGNLFGYTNDLEHALDSYRQAQKCLGEIDDCEEQVDSLRVLTEVKTAEGYWLAASGRYDEAEQSLTEAIPYAEKLVEMGEAPHHLSCVKGNMAELRYGQGRYEGAVRFATECIEVAEKPSYTRYIMDSLCVRISAQDILGEGPDQADIDRIKRLMRINKNYQPPSDLRQHVMKIIGAD